MLLPKHRLGVLIVDLLDPSTQPFHIKQAAMSVVGRSAPLLREVSLSLLACLWMDPDSEKH